MAAFFATHSHSPVAMRFVTNLKRSIPGNKSWELFAQQTQECRDSVIPPRITARVAVEQAPTFGWERFTGLTGECIGMRTFGASAPLKELQSKFGFTAENIVSAAKRQASGRNK